MIDESNPLGKRNRSAELEVMETVEAEHYGTEPKSRGKVDSSALQDEEGDEDVGPMPIPEDGASVAPRKKRKGGEPSAYFMRAPDPVLTIKL